ncbi:MAG: 50S ribosomal protein L9, partial [SAR202 cluster bacterium]|nr:50S ribosomal protein L9 [SAR202 cluster bacterium]
MRVRVLFLQDVLPRFRAGEIREVARGYARNYLIPRGLGVPATKDQLNRVEKVKQVATERRVAVSAQMSEVAKRLEGATITIRMRSGEGGRLYGAVTNMLMAEELQKAVGVKVDRRQ